MATRRPIVQYSPTAIPRPLTLEGIARWVEQELGILARIMQESTSLELRPIHAAPSNPRPGMIVYADGTDWNPGAGEGVYVYSIALAWGKL